MESWLLDEPKGGRLGELCVVKHFRDKRNESNLPDQFPELRFLKHVSILQSGCFAIHADSIHQLNLEDLVDLITETSVFMTVTDIFSHITLHALHQEQPLCTEEAGFVMGQTFAALEYLHGHRWAHGNLDPRSIHVMSRKHLWIKLTDTGISDYVDLGKPNGYHAIYASQSFTQADKSLEDIWSAGVVALQLLLPKGLPYRIDHYQSKWVQSLERLAVKRDEKSSNNETGFLRSVLKHKAEDRPTATKVLEDPWIVQTRGEAFIHNPHFSPLTPQESRHTSVGPSNAFSRQDSAGPSKSMDRGEYAPGSRHTSRAPSHNHSRQSSTDPTFRAMLQSHPYPGDDYNDFDSEHGTTVSGSSRFTANPLAREPRTPTPYYSDDSSGMPGRFDLLRSQRRSSGGRSPANGSQHGSTTSRSSRHTANPPSRMSQASSEYDLDDNSRVAGPGSLRSHFRSGGVNTPVNELATGTFGQERSRRKARTEDSGEETETDARHPITPAAKKPRRVVPPLEMNLRSRGNGRRWELERVFIADQRATDTWKEQWIE